jgi:hypothetical protein
MDSAIEHKNNDNSIQEIKINCYENSKTNIIKLQAHIKGFNIRQKLKTTLEHIEKKSDSAGNFNSVSKSLIVLYNVILNHKKSWTLYFKNTNHYKKE